MSLSRYFGIIGLACLLGGLTGCGKSKPSAEPTPNPQPGPGPQPGPATATDHELDPAKHKFPATPASGRINGAAFTPDRVELRGTHLTFFSGKDFLADQEVSVQLSNRAKLAEGYKVTVRPDEEAAWGGITPTVRIIVRKEKGVRPDMKDVKKFALTLELGKPEKGKYPGKIYLSVPDEQKSYLAGTFVVQQKRASTEPPGNDEVPFVYGTVSPPIKKGLALTVGYVGVADGKTISDNLGLTAGGPPTTFSRPRSGSLQHATLGLDTSSANFDFTNLLPGRYLIFARVTDGQAVWSWVDVADGARIEANLTLDPKRTGTVEVKLAKGAGNPRLVPADLGPNPLPSDFVIHMGFNLHFNPVTKDGVATFSNIPAGKYRVHDGSIKADVEVTAGKTVTVELKLEKK